MRIILRSATGSAKRAAQAALFVIQLRTMIIYRAIAPNGKSYIGQTVRTLQQRRQDHESASRHVSKINIGCRAFYAALRKYGAENFRWNVLCHARNMDELNALEEECIALHNTQSPNGYNLRTGGGNSRLHPETRVKLSAGMRGANNHRFGKPAHNRGKPLSAETRAKLSVAIKRANEKPEVRAKKSAAIRRAHANPEVRAKLSAAGKRAWENPEFREKMLAANRGKPAWNRGVSPSAETRAKQSAAHRGKKLSAEHRAKIGMAHRGKKQKNRKPMSAEQRAKMASMMRGKKLSAETRAKIAAAQRGKKRKPHSPESRAKISATQRGKKLSAESIAKRTATRRRNAALLGKKY
ncbi:MAG: GIY-YIG nuclease family protein [Gammaproteobacteria bacterium]